MQPKHLHIDRSRSPLPPPPDPLLAILWCAPPPSIAWLLLVPGRRYRRPWPRLAGVNSVVGHVLHHLLRDLGQHLRRHTKQASKRASTPEEETRKRQTLLTASQHRFHRLISGIDAVAKNQARKLMQRDMPRAQRTAVGGGGGRKESTNGIQAIQHGTHLVDIQSTPL